MKKYNFVDSAEAQELALCVINESSLYPKIKHVVKMLANKYKKGNYDHDKAARAYLWLVVDMAKIYHNRFGSPDVPYYHIFTPEIHYSAACIVADSFLENVEKDDL